MIRNIVFDVGNVLLRWDPFHVVQRLFPDYPDCEELTRLLFKSEHWMDINRGKLTESELIDIYLNKFGIDRLLLCTLMYEVKKSLLPVENNFELLEKLYLQYDLYTLTDNVREIMDYLQQEYDFWDKFKGIVVSAEVGVLKPDLQIYNFLIKKFKLVPDETLFIDDYLPNVEGARKAGLHAIQFIDSKQCIQEMQTYKIKI